MHNERLDKALDASVTEESSAEREERIKIERAFEYMISTGATVGEAARWYECSREGLRRRISTKDKYEND